MKLLLSPKIISPPHVEIITEHDSDSDDTDSETLFASEHTQDIDTLYYLFLFVLVFLYFCLPEFCHSELAIYIFITYNWRREFTPTFVIFAICDILFVLMFIRYLSSLYFCVKILAIVRPILYKRLTINNNNFERLHFE